MSIEALIEEYWRTRSRSDQDRASIRREVIQYLDTALPKRDKYVRDAEKAVRDLTAERTMLLRAHYEGAVPLEQLRSEQERINIELGAAERVLKERLLSRDQLQRSLDHALELMRDPHQAYVASGSRGRRLMNQAMFSRLNLSDDEIVDARLTDLFERLLDPNLKKLLDEELTSISHTARTGVTGVKTSKRSNLRPVYQDPSSNFRTWVAGTVWGFRTSE
ncbi:MULTISPECIES: hypothetical protein [Mycobacteriaceae]|nr:MULTISPECIES: hypothetical protein [Mycobacteriaceae]